jgi:hypothetical protein
MKNPTDEELNAVFAEKVAGWTRYAIPGVRDIWHNGMLSKDSFQFRMGEPPRFTTSFDAVLPYLEQFDGHTNGPDISFQQGQWEVVLNGCTTRDRAVHGWLPKAAVIALLRAHGVTVEFTT